MGEQQPRFYQFGPFRIDVVEHVLLRDDQPVPLTRKALETLLLFAKNRGQVIEKDRLMSELWPDSFVEESNLKVNISMIRKALGETASDQKYIVTVPGRGYRLASEVVELWDDPLPIVLEQHTTSSIVIEEAEGWRHVTRSVSRLGSWAGTLSGRSAIALSAVFAMLACALAYRAFVRRPQTQESVAEIKSIAVLPLMPLSPADDDPPLDLGITDTLITKLSNIKQIVVRPTSSVLKYVDPQRQPVQIGRELKVEAVLDGRVQKSRDRIRFSLQLLRVSDGVPVWGETFDGGVQDLFALQDSISRRVTDALKVKLSGEEQRQLAKNYTGSTEAYQAYLRGRHYSFEASPQGFQKAVEEFNRAIAIDPGYALAYSGLADAYTFASESILPPRDAMSRARAAASRALELDDTLADAHAALAHVRLHQWDRSAEDEFRRAIELNPNCSPAYTWYGEYLMAWGREDEALAVYQKARSLDPLSPVINGLAVLPLIYQRKYDEAIRNATSVLQTNPDSLFARLAIVWAYEQTGRYSEALEEMTKVNQIDPDSTMGLLGQAMALAGDKENALKVVTRMIEETSHRYVSPYEIARVYLALREKDKVFEWLNKAFDERAELIIFLRVEPWWDSVRQEPRFAELIGRTESETS